MRIVVIYRRISSAALMSCGVRKMNCQRRFSTANSSSVFMVTNVRVLHASYNQVLGNWTTDWEYELRAIEGPPSVEFDGRTYFIVIKPREERRPVY